MGINVSAAPFQSCAATRKRRDLNSSGGRRKRSDVEELVKFMMNFRFLYD